MAKKRHIIRNIILLSLFIIIIDIFVLWFTGKIWLNNPSRREYPVRGVDVSSYQGEIDWKVLISHSIDFAFIKATEGSTFVDKAYITNRNSIEKDDIDCLIGFYHFFSFDSTGKKQAVNFIQTVGELSGYLPPVVDIEPYGKYKYSKPDKDEVIRNLREMLSELESEYGAKPIIYATYSSYKNYIKGNFDDYPLWIRNVYFKPNQDWTFWQFTDKGLLNGYNGEERFIDMNVFRGSLDKLREMVIE